MNFSAKAQTPKERAPVMNRFGGYAMGFSWHSDHDAYYNNFNPGGAITYRLGEMDESKSLKLDLVAGGYHDSMRETSWMFGGKIEKKLGKTFSVGGMVGAVSYPKYLAERRQSTQVIITDRMEHFESFSRHGLVVEYSETTPVTVPVGPEPEKKSTVLGGQKDDRPRVPTGEFLTIKTVEDKRARGKGPSVFTPAAVPFIKATFGENWGVMIQGGLMPGTGWVFNSAVTFTSGGNRKNH